MALSNIYALGFLSDRLCVQSTSFDQQRNDELSGTGDGRIWTARLASPLWTARLNLHSMRAARAREISSKIWALDGTRRSFIFADPSYRPSSGATSLSGATIASISADRTMIGISGLPAGYAVQPGDFLSVPWASDRIFFGSFAESRQANSAGVMGQLAVTPYLPHGILVGAAVELVNPQLKMIVPPGGFTPFSFDQRGRWGQGASLNMVQKL